MGERTKLRLGIAGAAAMLGFLRDGLLRATPWGLNVFLFTLSLVGVAVTLTSWRGISFRGEGRLAGLPRLSETHRQAVEAGLLARWAGLASGDWSTYNFSRSRAHEAVSGGLPDTPSAEGRAPREEG